MSEKKSEKKQRSDVNQFVTEQDLLSSGNSKVSDIYETSVSKKSLDKEIADSEARLISAIVKHSATKKDLKGQTNKFNKKIEKEIADSEVRIILTLVKDSVSKQELKEGLGKFVTKDDLNSKINELREDMARLIEVVEESTISTREQVEKNTRNITQIKAKLELAI